MLTQQTVDIDGYTRAAGDLVAADASRLEDVPVLVPVGSPLEALVARWLPRLAGGAQRGAPRRNRPGGQLGLAAAVGADPGVAAAGRLYAWATGRRFTAVDDLAELRTLLASEADRDAVVIAVGQDAVAPLRSDIGDLLALGRRSGALGLLIARDVASLSWLVAKNLLPAPTERSRQLLFPQRSDEDVSDPGLTALHGAAAERFLGELRPDSPLHGLLAVEGHGRSDHVGAGESVICGDKLAHLGLSSGPEGTGRVPQCAHGLGCFRSGALVPVSMLPAHLLVLCSCTSTQVGPEMYEQSFLLGLSAVEGPARAVIGTTRPIDLGEWEVGFISALASAGVAYGHITRLLNDIYVQRCAEPPAFVLFGDPDSTLTGAPAHAGRPAPNTEDTEDPDGAVVAYQPDGRAAFIARMPAGPAFAPAPEGIPHGVGAAVLSHPDRRELVLWSDRGPLPSTAVVSLSGASKFESLRSRWEHVNASIGTNSALGLLPVSLNPAVRELRSLAHSLGGEVRQSRLFGGRSVEAERLRGRLDQQIREADHALARALLGEDHSFDFEDRIYERLASRATRYGERICWCGRQSYVTDQCARLGTAVVRRKTSCIQCGDYALTAVGGPVLEWDVVEFVPEGGSMTHRMRLTSSYDHAATGWLAMAISPAYGGSVTFGPQLTRFELAPGGTADLTVTMTTDGLKPHRYMVDAFVVHHLAADAYRRFIQVSAGGAEHD